jgi:cytochrome c
MEQIMSQWIRSFVCATLVLFFTAPVFAQEHGTAADAQKHLADGLAHIKAVGSQKAFEDFTAQGGPWQNKDVYLFCYRFDGTCACQGANKALVGKNLLDMQTADGVFLVKDIIEIARTKGSGSLEYQWAHPQTKKIATKASFVARVPGEDVVIGAGIYK